MRSWQEKLDLLQREIDTVREEYKIIRKESETMRKMFVELMGNLNSSMAPSGVLDINMSEKASPEVMEELQELKKENRFLKEKVDAQQNIIQQLSEALENS